MHILELLPFLTGKTKGEKNEQIRPDSADDALQQRYNKTFWTLCCISATIQIHDEFYGGERFQK